jgi:plasmid stabilization system protein ParE
VRLVLTSAAEKELADAASWYSDINADLGLRFISAVTSSLESIESQPLSFSPLETSNSAREFRRAALKRFPYSIVFEVFDDHVAVIAIAHVRRRPEHWRDRSETDAS